MIKIIIFFISPAVKKKVKIYTNINLMSLNIINNILGKEIHAYIKLCIIFMILFFINHNFE